MCLVTRGIHLESVSDGLAKTLLNAYRRFVARRGKPKYIISDKFTTPCSPQKGAVCECMVGVVKSALWKSLGWRLFDFKDYCILLCASEAVVNSRPLTHT